MHFKRSLAVASAMSAVLISGALAAGAVRGINNDAQKAGNYSPVDLRESTNYSKRGGAGSSSPANGVTGVSSDPPLSAASGVRSTTGSTATNAPSDNGSGAKQSGKGATASSGSTPQATTGGGPVAEPTTSTSFDDHGGGHGSDVELIDD